MIYTLTTTKKILNMKLKKLLGNNAHWSINKELYHHIGCLRTTLFLQHLIDLEDSFFDGIDFYQQDDRISKDLQIPTRYLKKCREKLNELGFLTSEWRGMPAKWHYTINSEKILQVVTGKPNTKVTHKPVTKVTRKPDTKVTRKPVKKVLANTKNLDTKNLDTKNRKEKELKNTKNLRPESLNPEPHLFVFSNTESISTGDIKVDSILDEL